MPYIGKEPALVPIDATDIPDNSITSAKIVDGAIAVADIATDGVGTAEIAANAVTNSEMADDAIGVAELSATGTANNSVYLRGDNSWSAVTHNPEGSDVLSTGESTTTKVLRTDGDGSSSWQTGVFLGTAQAWTATQTLKGITETEATNSTTTYTVDLANGTIFDLTSASAVTITMPSAAAGKSFTIIVKTAPAWSGTILWASATVPSAATISIYSFISDGTSWYGMEAGNGFA
jgi:hypothetical protein